MSATRRAIEGRHNSGLGAPPPQRYHLTPPPPRMQRGGAEQGQGAGATGACSGRQKKPTPERGQEDGVWGLAPEELQPEYHAVLTAIRFGLAASALGTRMVRIPSARLAWIFSASTGVGNWIVRVKSPKRCSCT